MIAPWVVFALTVVGPMHVEVVDTYRELDQCQNDAQHVRHFYQDLGQTDIKVTCESKRTDREAVRQHTKN
jgi:hypothetical protein